MVNLNSPKHRLITAVCFLVAFALAGAFWYMSRPNDVDQNSNITATGPETECALDPTTISTLKVAAKGEVAAFVPMDRPYSVAHFSFKDANGVSKTLADWSDRSVLINLWATWCAPCRAEMPFLDQLQRTMGSDKFEVLPISVDRGEPSKPKTFFKEIAIQSMSFFHDGDAMTLNALKREGLALGLPATLLIDTRGCVIGRLNGPAEWASEDAQNLIKAGI